ncbi:MAG: glycosyl hydrolase, partial [Acidobacteria bacterium]|nr:glycosyl hydrolase [Acidobacteriota bacterium]
MRGKRRLLMSAAILLAAGPLLAAVKIDSNTFGGLRARSIGPATMSGRVAALDAVAEDPLTIYVGAASGGVWKSENAGVTFEAVFDDYTQSIGAIRIDPSDPETVWVGTGEPWVRNSTSIGTGIYKTTDGGSTWELKGLGDSERIARIRISPADGDTLYVCAMGHLWDANEERGVYKTTDGGDNWERVLYIDDGTGCADLDMDPQDPDVLYAGMWEFRRSPDFFNSGGPGSGLYKSTDAGASWTELTNGLPAGDKGRITIAVAPSRANRIYAVVEADDTWLYRSDDTGHSWKKVNASLNVAMRPFYFGHMVVDPNDYNRVYKPGLTFGISDDGGKSFSGLFGPGGNIHGDMHAVWINPHNSNEILVGTDGGVYQSFDKGNHFLFLAALPISQFYEVGFDMEWPYNVYGGLQDNGTWMAPSRSGGGILNSQWLNIGFGDGFHAYPDPTAPNIVYVEYQGGQILRYHRDTGQIKQIKPYPKAGEPDLRCSWNTAMHLSPNNPGTLYVGCQYLFRSSDKGESWERISPDLTTDDPARQRQKESGGLSIDNSTAENNPTIYSISESPLDGEVLWVGTDDGNVQLTRNGGATWDNVGANIEVPAGLWVSFVEASPHDAATAFVTIDGHRSGDPTPYVFKTTDNGATWQSLVTDAIEGYAHVVRQDLENPELLFLGTEFGLFISLDGGAQWARFEGGVPKVAVRDLDIHPREHDLIIGTHGRGIYILDDLTPVRALTSETLEAKLAILPGRPAVQFLSSQTQSFNGDQEFVGSNLGEVASIFYYQKKRHLFGDMKVEIFGQDGELISTLPAGKRRGLNRVDWPMRLKAPKMPPATVLTFVFQGPRVPEGQYTYKITKGKLTLEGVVELVPDPRGNYSAEDRALQQQVALQLYDDLEDLTYLVDALIDLRDQTHERAEGAKASTAKRLSSYADELEALRGSLVSTSDAGWLSGDEKLREHLADVFGGIAGFDGRPTQSQIDRTAALAEELDAAKGRFAELTGASSI